MKLFSLFAPKRILTLALPALATLFIFGLSSQTPVHADAGCVTAKTWVDPANGHVAVGNGGADDTQNLQDLINYALAHQLAVKLEAGTYRITKTLIIQLAHPGDQYFGFSISGVSGPNRSSSVPNGGTAILMDAGSTTQPAVLEMGQGQFVDTIITNMALDSSVPNCGTKYGLYFAEQEFTKVDVHMVTVYNAGIAFATVAGTTGGGNGESVDISECNAAVVNCFYSNNDGQALFHHITNCDCGINNGGTAIKIGSGNQGFDMDVNGLSGTFTTGTLRNTFLENDGVSGCVNIKGGRIEWCDTLLSYTGNVSFIGSVAMRGIDFSGTNAYVSNNAWVLKSFPFIDASTASQAQNNNIIEDCHFYASSGSPHPALSLASGISDLSRTYFDRCIFVSYSNKLTDLSNMTATGVIPRNCRTAPDPSTYLGNFFTNMP